ncbi:MAG: alanine racemase [Wenzhouxiangellaceae bacterium]|nr:alanine racemase [Wenzhouxiangellaceae bacterium]
MSRDTYATIDVPALQRNLERVRTLAEGARLMVAVKADAYGHGLERCVPALERADMLAVATLDEARAVRALSAQVPLLLLEGITAAEEMAAVEALRLEMVVHHESQLEWLESISAQPGKRLWLKIETGMHRLGFAAARVAQAHARLMALTGVEEVVLMSHFACADAPLDPLNRRQMECFDQAVAGLPGPHCLANSAALLQLPQARRDWVRAGLLIYGASPSPDISSQSLGLAPVMTLETQLIAVKTVLAGEAIGYGARYTAAGDMRIGVAAVGYGDGYPRNMPDGAPVLVNGRRARLAGRVSMDMITIDLEGQPTAGVGDPVVLWGRGLPVEEVAGAVDTIPYELFCRVTRRVSYRQA